MRVRFLGTSAGVPTLTRNVTCHALVLDNNETWLVDCGDGSQQQAMRYGLKAQTVAGILLTHLHGDHCYGLPGILSWLAINGRTEPVQLVGPAGVAAWIRLTLAMSEAEPPFALHITELTKDRHQVAAPEGWSGVAVRISHRIACWGYVLHEPPRPRRMDRARAESLNIPAQVRGRLVKGESVTLADGRIMCPEDCCEPARPGRKLVFLGDTDNADAIIPDAQGADLIVREATFAADLADKARTWGHSTTLMTGAFAAQCHAKILAVTHWSARYTVAEPDQATQRMSELVNEIQSACPGITIHPADDGSSVMIP